MRLGTVKRHFVEGHHSMKLNPDVSHAKLSGRSRRQWMSERAEAGEAAGKEAAVVETTPSVVAVNTEPEGEEATTVAARREITTAVVDAVEAPTQRSSITG